MKMTDQVSLSCSVYSTLGIGCPLRHRGEGERDGGTEGGREGGRERE